MLSSEDYRREKTKYSKNEFVKSTLTNYLQKRNYSTFQPKKVTRNQLHVFSSVENEISNPNSIGYRCYNCDPVIIDNNFSKFLVWLKEAVEDQYASEIQQLIGPIFCHLYLDILQGGHAEKATTFFITHVSSVEKVNKDPFIRDLMNSLTVEGQSNHHKQEFRLNKYVVQMSAESKKKLMNYVAEHCHVIFLQVFQTWFEIEIMNAQIMETETDLIPNECCLNSKFQKILNAAAELDNSTKMVFSVDVSNVISEVNCGLISRYHGLLAYNQGNIVDVYPLHNFNNLSSSQDSKMIKLNGHTTKVYTLAISKSYLASASSDGKICIYRTGEFETVKVCSGHLKTVYCLKISSNELYLASGSEDNTIRLWNVENGHFLRVFIGHEQAVVCLDFHPNCLYLISGSTDKNIRMWNIETANPLRLLCGSQGRICDIACNPAGQYLVSSSDDKYLRTWDILTGTIIAEVKCKNAFLDKLRWSKDGNLLCGAFSDNTLKIWNYKNFDSCSNRSVEVLQTINCPGTSLSLEYCFGTFAVLTTKCIPET